MHPLPPLLTACQVVAQVIDTSVYRGQLELNAELHESAKIRKYSGSCATGAPGSNAAPFATAGAQGDEWLRGDYQPKKRHDEVAHKVERRVWRRGCGSRLCVCVCGVFVCACVCAWQQLAH